jgi:6-pyruvoyltetrahydropterin/6-carboxytetrahydropterin synthase
MIRLTRRYSFAASHRLHSHELSDAENTALYGKCNNPYGHGHNYVLEVTVAGPLDSKTGQVVNPATLDGLVTQSILRNFDNKNLNEDVAEFACAAPTSENLTLALEARLRAGWDAAFAGQWPRLDGIRLRETRKNTFEWHA